MNMLFYFILSRTFVTWLAETKFVSSGHFVFGILTFFSVINMTCKYTFAGRRLITDFRMRLELETHNWARLRAGHPYDFSVGPCPIPDGGRAESVTRRQSWSLIKCMQIGQHLRERTVAGGPRCLRGPRPMTRISPSGLATLKKKGCEPTAGFRVYICRIKPLEWRRAWGYDCRRVLV